jgi:hypothetical protein
VEGKEMGNALQAYTQQYEDQDQMLFQAIIKLKRGNKKAFEQVYNLSERYIYTIIYRIVRDNEKTACFLQVEFPQFCKIFFLRGVGNFAGHAYIKHLKKYLKQRLGTVTGVVNLLDTATQRGA